MGIAMLLLFGRFFFFKGLSDAWSPFLQTFTHFLKNIILLFLLISRLDMYLVILFFFLCQFNPWKYETMKFNWPLCQLLFLCYYYYLYLFFYCVLWETQIKTSDFARFHVNRLKYFLSLFNPLNIFFRIFCHFFFS